MTSSHTTPRLDLIGLVVEDMARSLAFYRQLGLEIPPEADAQPHAESMLAGGIRLAWDTAANVKTFHPDYQAPTGSPRVGLAFLCASPADVDATYDSLVAAGYHGEKPPWDAEWGQRYALIHDPDGNSADLFAPLTD